MAYSGDPSDSYISAIRFWLQDTGTPSLLTDDEIDYLVSFSGLDPDAEPIAVAALGADRIAAKYAGEVSISSDGVNYSGEQLQRKYSQLAKDLRKEHRRQSGSDAPPYVGGITPGERPPANVTEPQFGIGMWDNPPDGSQAYGYTADEGYHRPDGWVGA